MIDHQNAIPLGSVGIDTEPLENRAGLIPPEMEHCFLAVNQTRPFFKEMHEQPVYNRVDLFAGDACPVTGHIERRGLNLPSGQAITDRQIADVVQAVIKVLS